MEMTPDPPDHVAAQQVESECQPVGDDNVDSLPLQQIESNDHGVEPGADGAANDEDADHPLPSRSKSKKRRWVKLKEGDSVRIVAVDGDHDNDGRCNSKRKRHGVVRLIGETVCGDATFYGIELVQGSGECDGSIDGVSYFECAPGMGLFARRSALRRIAPKSKRSKSKKRSDSEDADSDVDGGRSDGDASKSRKSRKRRLRVKKRKNGKMSKSKGRKRTSTTTTKRKRQNKKLKKKRNDQMPRSATLGAMDFDEMFGDKTGHKTKDDAYYEKMRRSLHKAGPREIGTIKYDGIKPDSKQKGKRNKKRSKKRKQKSNLKRRRNKITSNDSDTGFCTKSDGGSMSDGDDDGLRRSQRVSLRAKGPDFIIVTGVVWRHYTDSE